MKVYKVVLRTDPDVTERIGKIEKVLKRCVKGMSSSSSAGGITARWFWTQGRLEDRSSSIVWDIEGLNSDKSEFVWTKGTNVVLVKTQGLYRICFAVFTV